MGRGNVDFFGLRFHAVVCNLLIINVSKNGAWPRPAGATVVMLGFLYRCLTKTPFYDPVGFAPGGRASLALPRAILRVATEKAGAGMHRLGFFRPRRLYGNGIPDGALTKKARCLSTASFLLTRDSVGIRTQDPQLRRLLLYPAELPNHPAYSAGKKAAPANRTANIGIFYYLAMFFLRKVSFGCKIAIIFAGNTEF